MPRWWKKMSRTDAQQKTKGWLVRYLRLTKGWGDRELLFDGVGFNWGVWAGKPVQETHLDFRVIDDGTPIGVLPLRVTYDPSRLRNHKHPATWIHWGAVLESHLKANDREKWFVLVERDNANSVPHSISFIKKRPQP